MVVGNTLKALAGLVLSNKIAQMKRPTNKRLAGQSDLVGGPLIAAV